MPAFWALHPEQSSLRKPANATRISGYPQHRSASKRLAVPPNRPHVLLRPISGAGIALSRLDERISRSPVGQGFVERSHFTDACASLWIDGELVHLEDLVLHDANHDVRAPTHELTVARDVLKTRRRIGAILQNLTHTTYLRLLRANCTCWT
ncbi:hypothetical protein AJ87_21630 [Rhizobium yanglingense]|nr:hypothetical protein AJ87_21630 [Rhizobium yanglingense]